MRKLLMLALCILLLTQSVAAVDFSAPPVPDSGAKLMPRNRESFSDGLWEIIHTLIKLVRPDLAEALRIGAGVIASVLLVSILQASSESVKRISELAGVICIAALVFRSTSSLIHLGSNTIRELTEYEKLLLPVLTSAIAAQGGIGTATALYAGTAMFNTLLSNLLCEILLPIIYFYQAFAVAAGALDELMLDKMKEAIKKTVFWVLKALLSVFTGYLGLTGVISGATDATALKVTRAAISTLVPIVGKIIADASEAVLVSAGMAKNAIGIYGIYAILAVFLGPFVKIGIHFLIFKATALICFVFGTKRISGVIDDMAAAMGLILAATGTMCLLLLISCICFLKGAG